MHTHTRTDACTHVPTNTHTHTHPHTHTHAGRAERGTVCVSPNDCFQSSSAAIDMYQPAPIRSAKCLCWHLLLTLVATLGPKQQISCVKVPVSQDSEPLASGARIYPSRNWQHKTLSYRTLGYECRASPIWVCER